MMTIIQIIAIIITITQVCKSETDWDESSFSYTAVSSQFEKTDWDASLSDNIFSGQQVQTAFTSISFQHSFDDTIKVTWKVRFSLYRGGVEVLVPINYTDPISYNVSAFEKITIKPSLFRFQYLPCKDSTPYDLWTWKFMVIPSIGNVSVGVTTESGSGDLVLVNGNSFVYEYSTPPLQLINWQTNLPDKIEDNREVVLTVTALGSQLIRDIFIKVIIMPSIPIPLSICPSQSSVHNSSFLLGEETIDYENTFTLPLRLVEDATYKNLYLYLERTAPVINSKFNFTLSLRDKNNSHVCYGYIDWWKIVMIIGVFVGVFGF